jgi:tetratricopeptide (TPR) repeat protein
MKRSMKSFAEKARWRSSKLGYSAGEISDELLAQAMRLHLEGDNDEAAALLNEIPPSERSARLWRILGHAELARGATSIARDCHEQAIRMNLEAGDNDATVGDLVNLAAVHIDVGALDAAWQAAERAHDLVPDAWIPHVVKISVLNNRGDHGALKSYLAGLLHDRPGLTSNPDFRRHVESDLDFIGVAAIIQEKLK